MVSGGTMEGGAELIGSNHAIWQQYRERFGLRLLAGCRSAGSRAEDPAQTSR